MSPQRRLESRRHPVRRARALDPALCSTCNAPNNLRLSASFLLFLCANIPSVRGEAQISNSEPRERHGVSVLQAKLTSYNRGRTHLYCGPGENPWIAPWIESHRNRPTLTEPPPPVWTAEHRMVVLLGV
eukprot:4709289-Amphidinium_carterae.1